MNRVPTHLVKSSPSVLQNVNLFGDGIVADVVRWDEIVLEWGENARR